jgi:hypothetical protein
MVNTGTPSIGRSFLIFELCLNLRVGGGGGGGVLLRSFYLNYCLTFANFSHNSSQLCQRDNRLLAGDEYSM